MRPERLILVYNTDNGYFNALTDWAHKFFSPATYACTLCRYTYSTRGMLFPWKAFLESLRIPLRFLHRSEFHEFYPRLTVPLPIILVEVNGMTALLLSAEEIQAAEDLDGLIAATQLKLVLPIEELDQASRA